MLRAAPRRLAVVMLFAALQPITPADADDGRRNSGFYFGGHVGYMFGNANATLGDPIGVTSAGGVTPYGSFFGGVQAGYEHFFASRLMLGIELDASFVDYLDLAQVLSYRATNTGTATEQLEYLASLRGRLGYDMGGWTPFVTGGIAWASTRFSRIDLTTGNEDANPSNVRLGYVVGGGIDRSLGPRWSARAEYLYTNFGLTGFLFNSAPARYDSQFDLHRFRIGLNYKFGEAGEKNDKTEDRGPGTFEFHVQTVGAFQGYPPFSAPYDGP
ncbi:MAG: outer membrane protein, partial [Solimonas sp.]